MVNRCFNLFDFTNFILCIWFNVFVFKIDTFNNNVTIIADSNHGYKMLGVGCLVAEELLGEKQELLEPFRFSRFKEGKLHPVSNSPYPWS